MKQMTETYSYLDGKCKYYISLYITTELKILKGE